MLGAGTVAKPPMRRPVICEPDLPPIGGAYALLVETRSPARLVVRDISFRLAPGEYLYCGSARGPGGIRARVGRHMRKKKALRWHIDRLTGIGRIRGVIVAPGGAECALFARFAALERAEVPVPGFGASDCRRCPAHLLRIDGLIQRVRELPLEAREWLVLEGADSQGGD